jgi:hypothetical protein
MTDATGTKVINIWGKCLNKNISQSGGYSGSVAMCILYVK